MSPYNPGRRGGIEKDLGGMKEYAHRKAERIRAWIEWRRARAEMRAQRAVYRSSQVAQDAELRFQGES